MTVEHDHPDKAFQRCLPGEFQPKFKVPNGSRTLWAVDREKAERPIESLLQEVYPNLGDDFAASLEVLHDQGIKTVGDLRNYAPDASSLSKLGPVVGLIHQARAETFLSEDYTKDTVGRTSVDNLALSARITNLLHRYGIHTWPQLLAELPNIQSNIKGIGPKSEAKIRATLQNPPSISEIAGKQVGAGKEGKSRSPVITRLNLLATGIEKVIEKSAGEPETFGLNRARDILREIGQEVGNPPTYPYLLIVDSWIKIAVVLGNWPTSAGKISVTDGGRWQYRLTLPDLRDILKTTARTLQETGLSQHTAARRAYETFSEKKERGIPVKDLLDEVATALGRKKPLTKGGKKILVAEMQRNDIPEELKLLARDAFIFGVLPEKRESFIAAWSSFPKEDTPPSTSSIMKNWPSLSGFLRETVGTRLSINPRSLAQAVTWLQDQGIPIEVIIRRYRRIPPMTYFRISPTGQEQLKEFLTDETHLKELKAVFQSKS